MVHTHTISMQWFGGADAGCCSISRKAFTFPRIDIKSSPLLKAYTARMLPAILKLMMVQSAKHIPYMSHPQEINW